MTSRIGSTVPLEKQTTRVGTETKCDAKTHSCEGLAPTDSALPTDQLVGKIQQRHHPEAERSRPENLERPQIV